MINLGSTQELTVSAMGVNGEGVAKIDGFAVFVDGALPREEIIATITAVKPHYAKGSLRTIKKAAGDRIAPACTRYSDCGGCQIMHLAYPAQLAQKTQLVKDALKHIGGQHDAEVLPCLASPKPFHYRNKIQLPVGRAHGKIVTGFYRRGSHEIVPFEHCLIHHPSMGETVLKLRALLENSSIEPCCESSPKGTLRHLLLRANAAGQQLIGLVTRGTQKKQIITFADRIMKAMPNVVGVVENIQKTPNVIFGEKAHCLAGRPYLEETLDGLTFKISLESFFQVNLEAAKLLYDTALTMADITKNDTVLDAYCGTGTMALLAARKAKAVIGAECVRQAVRDANDNACFNHIKNANFVVAKIEEKPELFRNIDIALVNPPRKGLDGRVVAAIDAYGPKRMVYVSCNPATLARDAKMLKHYQLIRVQPVDMFPQTMHVESVALFHR